MINGEKITPLIVNARVAHEHNQATNNTITYKVYDSNSEHSLQHAVEVRSAHCTHTVPEHSFVTFGSPEEIGAGNADWWGND